MVPTNREVPCSGRARADGPVGSAVGADDDPVMRELESAGHLVARVRRRHHDTVCPVRVCARQHRIIASDFPGASFGMHEKVDVVDRDQLGGIPGRDQERRRRMHDIERPGSQGFDGRPLPAMPEPVQHRPGHAPVHPSGTRRDRCGQSVLEGTAEDRDFQAVGALGARRAPRPDGPPRVPPPSAGAARGGSR